MRKTTKMLALLLSLMLVMALLGACGSSSTSSSAASSAPAVATEAPAATATAAPAAEPAKKPYIPVICKGFQHQFWQSVKLGAEQAAAQYNVDITFEGPEGESQVDKQIDMLQTDIGKNPAAICFAAIDSKAVIPLLQQAKDKNIPIIGFDSGVDSDIPVTTCTTDNVAAAALAADKLAEAIGSKGEIGIICHDQVSQTAVDRRDGFTNQIKSKYPDIKIVDLQYGGGDQAKSADIAKTMMQAHPNLKAIFGTNEGSAIGCIKGVIEAKMDGKIVVVGYDAGKAQKDAVRSGQMLGSITQDPVGIGFKAVEAAVKAINGETLPKTIDTGFKWYDKTNMDQAEFKQLLYD
jgi:ribose transport system substrate-binding protein